jgi:hypothetical protein
MNYFPHEVDDIKANTKLHTLPMVYVIEANGSDYIKIGYAKTIKQRLSNIQNGCPYKLTIWLGIFTPRFKEIERYLHSKFNHCKVRGEWFAPTDNDLDELCNFFAQTNAHIKGIARGIRND